MCVKEGRDIWKGINLCLKSTSLGYDLRMVTLLALKALKSAQESTVYILSNILLKWTKKTYMQEGIVTQT